MKHRVRYGVLLALGLLVWGPARAQAQDTLTGIHRQGRVRIDSVKVEFDARNLRNVQARASVTVTALARITTLVLSLPCTRVKDVTVAGRSVEPVREGDLLGIRLSGPLARGEQSTLVLEYDGAVPGNTTYSFPFHLPCDADPDFAIDATFRVPSDRVVVTPGTLRSAQVNRDHACYRWSGRYRPRAFDTPLVRGKLIHRETRGIRFSLVCMDRHAAVAGSVLDAVSEVYFFLQELYGPRASHDLAVVQSPAADRMQTRFNSGGIICLQTTDLEDGASRWLRGCLAHEIAHEWWGHRVYGSEEDRQRITEALAEFSSLHAGEKLEGLSSAEEDVIIHTMAYLRGDRAAVAETRDRIYSKSVLIYRHLMHVIGEQAFFRAARRVLEQQAGKPVSHRLFFRTVEEVTGRDLQWLLDWLYHTDADLDFALERLDWTREQGKYRNRILVTERIGRYDYPLEVSLEIATQDGRALTRSLHVGRTGAWLEVETDAPVVSAAVDPGWGLWDIDRSNNVLGRHVLSTRTSPDRKIRVDLVGGFRSRYDSRRWISLWMHGPSASHRVDLDGVQSGRVPEVVFEPGTARFMVLYEAEPIRALSVVPAPGNGPPILKPLVPDGSCDAWLQTWLASSRQRKLDELVNHLESRERARIRKALRDLEASTTLSRPGTLVVAERLLALLAEPRPDNVRIASFRILYKLASLHGPRAHGVLKKNLKVLLAGLEDPVFSVRSHAAHIFQFMPEPAALEPLCRSLVRDLRNVNCQAIYALRKIGDTRAVPTLIQVLGSPDLWGRWNAANALAALPDRRAVAPLIRTLEHEDPSTYTEDDRSGMTEDDPDPVRTACARALESITGQQLGKNVAAWKKWLAQNPGQEQDR